MGDTEDDNLECPLRLIESRIKVFKISQRSRELSSIQRSRFSSAISSRSRSFKIDLAPNTRRIYRREMARDEGKSRSARVIRERCAEETVPFVFRRCKVERTLTTDKSTERYPPGRFSRGNDRCHGSFRPIVVAFVSTSRKRKWPASIFTDGKPQKTVRVARRIDDHTAIFNGHPCKTAWACDTDVTVIPRGGIVDASSR